MPKERDILYYVCWGGGLYVLSLGLYSNMWNEFMKFSIYITHRKQQEIGFQYKTIKF